ncbi:MAG: hypothetical protein ACOVSW_13825 [Candidatus Kapaibacteriota bacterium]|jgi:hypothetical protein
MLSDPIIEELHNIRQEFAATFQFDMNAIVQHLQQQQRDGKHEIVSFVKKDLAETFAEVEAHKQGRITLPTLTEFLADDRP